jgi:3-deoxy-manno-octulosonate cytidylyltransferase (CMP-KDO synthetase)
MKITAVIPARLESTRFPRKILADIDGKPMLWHVWSRVMQAQRINEAIVATDSEEVLEIVNQWGGYALMTSPACSSGTDRIASLLPMIPSDYIINIQGDEPLIDPLLIDALADRCFSGNPELVTAVYPLASLDELTNTAIVKVVRNASGRAIYFSRQTVPYVRDHCLDQWLQQSCFWGHVGIYAYQREILSQFSTMPVSQLESAEKLEQLRFIEAGYQFDVVETSYHPYAVDYPADISRVLAQFPQVSGISNKG